MMKYWWIYLLGLLIIAAALGYYFLPSETTQKVAKKAQGKTSASFPLKVGSKGWQVEELQKRINEDISEYDVAKLTVDGVFGEKTKEACMLIFALETISEKDFKALVYNK